MVTLTLRMVRIYRAEMFGSRAGVVLEETLGRHILQVNS
jgi:hypothetical protein